LWSIKFGIPVLRFNLQLGRIQGNPFSFEHMQDTLRRNLTISGAPCGETKTCARIPIAELAAPGTNYSRSGTSPNGKMMPKTPFVIQTHRYTIVRIVFVVDCWKLSLLKPIRTDV